ncbi:hypothetical protein [Mycoplana sp. MJR14]|uniref:hypothetical protein n=1 Tax=Mycoplana sp. MJR14 TaxID=3032583 RepID=UPI0023DA6FF8|nr:hypothetical protein [Mycoplana sp. MJR14]MDF1635500.1 hypothetical protein [Mycoplana sp. MJR14]
MALKICVVGNSHVGALKFGWENIRSSHRHELTFLGVPGTSVRDLTVEHGIVLPTTNTARKFFLKTSGSEGIALDSYDVVLLVGAGLTLTSALSLTNRWRPYGLVDETIRDSQSQFNLVSDQLFAELISSRVRKSFANRLLRKVTRQSAVRALYVTTPLPSSELRLARSDDPVLSLIAGTHGPSIASLYRNSLERVMGKDKVIFPPAHALVDGAMTDARYSRGSLRLDGEREHPDTDLNHMNAAYGALVLEEVFNRLGSATSSR